MYAICDVDAGPSSWVHLRVYSPAKSKPPDRETPQSIPVSLFAPKKKRRNVVVTAVRIANTILQLDSQTEAAALSAARAKFGPGVATGAEG